MKMADAFDLISDDFVADLNDIRSVVRTFDSPTFMPKTRVAAANSATLLLAATFEEFVREMAREYARAVVNGTGSFAQLPRKLAGTAWKRTMDGLGKIKFDEHASGVDLVNAANAKFSTIYEFCRGDLTKEIYMELIHNDSNMRPTQLNELFNVSGLSDVCRRCSGEQVLLDHFGETEPNVTHGKLITALQDFFERRNGVAHSIAAMRSSGASQILTEIDLLERFARALSAILESNAPPVHVRLQP